VISNSQQPKCRAEQHHSPRSGGAVRAQGLWQRGGECLKRCVVVLIRRARELDHLTHSNLIHELVERPVDEASKSGRPGTSHS